MLILGIETATPQVGCAIGGHEGILASFHAARGMRHAETLAPAISFICDRSDVELADLGAIAVDIGPGLFTGLRVGVATAKAMALALRIPVVGVASLDLLAFRARRSDRLIVAAIDARRGELYYALYRQVPGGAQRITNYQVGSPEDVASELQARGEDALLIGDGGRRYVDVFAEAGRIEFADPELMFPAATALVELAHPRALREEFVPPWELEPLYLRKADAEINWEQREQGGRAAMEQSA